MTLTVLAARQALFSWSHGDDVANAFKCSVVAVEAVSNSSSFHVSIN